jgi:hypothetical protein
LVATATVTATVTYHSSELVAKKKAVNDRLS